MCASSFTKDMKQEVGGWCCGKNHRKHRDDTMYHNLILPTSFLTLSAHVQEGYGTCLSVCLSVSLCICLSVTTLAATSFVLTLEIRYVGGYYRGF